VAVDARIRELLEYLDEGQQRLFACECAERALERQRADGREPDARSWRALEVTRAFARGEADEAELAFAYEDAIAAADEEIDAWYPAAAAHAAAYAAADYAAFAVEAVSEVAAAYPHTEPAWQMTRLEQLTAPPAIAPPGRRVRPSPLAG
jgi:hypothetical protein